MVAKKKQTPRPVRKAKRPAKRKAKRPASKVATAKRATFTVSEVRDNLSDAVTRVAYLDERVALTRHGKTIAVIVPAQDAALLDALEEAGDLDAAREALAEAERTGNVAWKKVKADLGL